MIDLNKLRNEAKPPEMEQFSRLEGESLDERILALEAMIAAGMSDEERAVFEEENNTTPEKTLQKMKLLKVLRTTNPS